MRLILIYTVHRTVEGWVDLDSAVCVQSVPKAAYRSNFRENSQKTWPQPTWSTAVLLLTPISDEKKPASLTGYNTTRLKYNW